MGGRGQGPQDRGYRAQLVERQSDQSCGTRVVWGERVAAARVQSGVWHLVLMPPQQ